MRMMKINNIHITLMLKNGFTQTGLMFQKLLININDGIYPKSDVLITTEKLVEMFDNHDIRATFFVLGETAEKYPEIIEILKASDHEIACHGWFHNKKYEKIHDFKKDINKV